MNDSSIPASHRDPVESAGVAVLSTIGDDGYPQSTALWFLLDGEVIRTSLHRSRQKYKNLLAHAQATLFVLDPSNPYRTVEIRGDVTFDDDADKVFLQRLVARYDQDLDTFPVPTDDQVVPTLTPRHVVTDGDEAG